MIFELFVLGKIKSGNAGGRGKHLYDIRKQVDLQMRRVWDSHPLKEIDDAKHFRRANSHPGDGAVIVTVGSSQFVPLVSPNIYVACRLEIVFYEPEGSLSIVSDVTDIDNRLKTLFDALRMPTANEIGEHEYGKEFYCLLADDKLIWEVNVKRTRLLREIEGQNSMARVRVELVATRDTYANTSLIGIVVH